jgi:diamine N-acetyltransferase
MDLTFREIGIQSVEILSNLAQKAYRDHYLHLWKDNNADWYINKCFLIAPLTQELNNPNNKFYIIFDNEKPLGFLKLVLNHPLSEGVPADSINDKIEPKMLYLERIYFVKEAIGKGIGEKTMQLAFQKATEWDYHGLWLSAMDSSIKPIAFYKRMGFEIIATKQLDFNQIKDEMRGMVVMKKMLF